MRRHAASGHLTELTRALGERDAACVLDLALKGKGAARKQLFETIEADAAKMRRKWRAQLEQKPGDAYAASCRAPTYVR